jgi:hypothetical protein
MGESTQQLLADRLAKVAACSSEIEIAYSQIPKSEVARE